MDREKIIKSIEEIASRPGFIYVLSLLLLRDNFVPIDEIIDINWRDKLSIQEFGFLIGLMVKHPVEVQYPNPDQVERDIGDIYRLFEELHQSHNEPFWERFKESMQREEKPTEEEIEAEYHEMFGAGDTITEPMFYGGSGAYDFQYLELTPKKYARDSEWIQTNKGFSLKTAAEIATFLKKLVEEKRRQRGKPKLFNDFYEKSFRLFAFSKTDLASFAKEDVEAFISAFSLVPGSVNSGFKEVGQYNTFNSHPIIRLGEDLFFVPATFLLTQSLYESPFYWMYSDNAYRDTAAENRGKTTEEIAFEMLQPVFAEGLYKNIKVARSRTEDATDIDILGVAGNKAVVFQVKSKRLTELARRGSTEKLKEDFSEAIQKAYDQALISRTAILSKESKLTDSLGNEIKLEESINEVYIVCLTSDEYPALTSQIEHYLSKKDGEPLPIGVSILDLELLAFYLKDPFEFLYYLRQRIRTSDFFRATNEIIYLAFHLKRKLIKTVEDKQTMMVLADDYAQLIDANYPVVRGYIPADAKGAEELYPKWKNARFEQLIKQIKDTKDPGFTDAIFYLYDLAGDGADDVIAQMDVLLDKARRDGKQHDCSMIFEKGKSGISMMSSLQTQDLSERLMLLAMARKYKTKADTWLALGVYVDSQQIVNTVGFNDAPWKYDADLEELAKGFLKAGTQIRTKEKIGRNEKCPCGSGQKYKRCCGR